MCKVYAFPSKKEFPNELEERLNEISKGYVNIIVELLETLYDGDPTEEEYQECIMMVSTAYAKSLGKAIEELD